MQGDGQGNAFPFRPLEAVHAELFEAPPGTLAGAAPTKNLLTICSGSHKQR